jgi:2-phosphosulfolactate phosphatase
MWIDVILSPALLPERLDSPGEVPVTAVAIDILRATTVMVTALQCRVNGILPVSSPEEGLELQRQNPDWLLAGEVEGLPPEGFHFGNSPLALTTAQPDTLAGKNLIMSTTNGTRLIHRVSRLLTPERDTLYIGALMNREALCQRVASDAGRSLYFCCAGQKGRVGIEDVAFAGYAIQRLQELLGTESLTLGDGAHLALSLIQGADSPQELLYRSHHGQELIQLGLQPDLIACSQLDTAEGVPVFEAGWVR